MSATDAMEIQALLRAHAPRAPEALRARVLAAGPAPRRLRVPPRRLALVVLPAALGLAVAAALVHGFAGSGRTVQHGAVATRELGRPAAPTMTLSDAAGSGGVATSTTAMRQALAPAVAGSGRLQHTDASLQVRVPDVDRLSAATSAATRIATSLGGYAQSVVYRTPQRGGGESSLELRVPAQNVRTAIARLAALGTLVSQQVSTQDLERLFETQSAQIAQLRRRIVALRAALRDPALPEAQKVLLRIKLAESQRALSQRLHARKGTVAAGTTARVSLVLSTKESVVPVAHHRGRLGRMLHSALGFLALEGTIALYALIVLSPLALLGGLVWGLGRAWRRRSEERLLAA